MKTLKGNIYDHELGDFRKGKILFEENIFDIIFDNEIEEECFILPGLIDSHVHIESSLLSPKEYAKESLKHGVIAAITDPHEIANVCGIDGIKFMLQSSTLTPMKIFTGAPSCVPATDYETSGAIIGAEEIDVLFKNDYCYHLSEMMNFPGVIYEIPEVIDKLKCANRHRKIIDGHAPAVSGDNLVKYLSFGITTDHECSTIDEALEKISLGMMIMLRESSASKDFERLMPLIDSHPDSVMFCTDDCHPDDLQKGYIEKLFKNALAKNFAIKSIIKASSLNAIKHYNLPVGKLQIKDSSDFIVVDNLKEFNILKTLINGEEVFNGNNVITDNKNLLPINNFYSNSVSIDDIKVKKEVDKKVNIVKVIPDSLFTSQFKINTNPNCNFIEPDINNDILKIIVVNRYQKAVPSIGFINGFNLKKGAFGGSVAHDSHNLIIVGSNDFSIIHVLKMIQNNKGGLAAYDGSKEKILPLPIAGLMSDKSCWEVANDYTDITAFVNSIGCELKSPFMTLAFMALLVIPELKIGDKGLFDVTKFSFVDLQS
jgi:adenine deaminase